MKMRKMLGLLTVALLLMQLPLTALAATYQLADGSVYITTDSGYGQIVWQDKNDEGSAPTDYTKWTKDEAPVIDGGKVETENTIVVTTKDNENANVTLKDVVVNNPNGAGMLVDRAENTTVIVELDGENSLTADNYAGLQTSGDGTLVIQDENNDGGSLTARGGYEAAGIGGASGQDGKNIVINSGEITAIGAGEGGAGIGGGCSGDGANITINGGTVLAQGGFPSAGIGGGQNGDANNITITGGDVTAYGRGGAAIGGGAGGIGTGISVSGDAKVTADADAIHPYGAADVGNGMILGNKPIPEDQKEFWDEETGTWKDNVDTSGLYETGSLTMGQGENAETIVGDIPDPALKNEGGVALMPVPAIKAEPVEYGEYLYGGPGTWSETSHMVDEAFWADVVAQLYAAEAGKAVLINAGDRKVMPASVMEAVRETGITLIIQWDGGPDIIIEKAYPYKDAYQVYWLQNLNRILANV